MGLKDILFIAVIAALVIWAAKSYYTAATTEYTEEFFTKQSEYKTYVANQILNIVLYGLELADSPDTQMLYPAENENLAVLTMNDIEVSMHYNWEIKLCTITYQILRNGQILEKEMSFRFRNDRLPLAKIMKFVAQMRDDYDDFNNITEQDIVDFLARGKDMPDFANKEDAKTFYYDCICDMLMEIRKPRNYKNREMVRIYGRIVRHLLKTEREEFMKYLSQEDENNKGNE